MISFKPLLTIIKEFIRALGRRHTYNIRKNSYLIFGILWGIPVPLVTIGMGIYYKNLPFSLAAAINEVLVNPLQLFFLSHPLLFGLVFGAMGTVRDDKEKQKLKFQKSLIEANRELKDKNEKLEELDQLKDSFLSMVSHELLSPLTTVQGYVSFIRQEKAGKITQEQKDMLGVIEDQAEYLNNIIADLIDISKIEAGKLQIDLEPLEVKKLILPVIKSFKQTAEAKKIILDYKLSLAATHILADRRRIIQVFTNILSNAIKFTPFEGRVTIDTKKNNQMVEFSIVDTGIGIPASELGRIFDKFYQVDSCSQRKYGGCGLGLAITKSIIELHQGRIWVESEVNEGSKFFFAVPEYN